MRLRLLIPAVIAAVATYAALVRDEVAVVAAAPQPTASPVLAPPAPPAPVASQAPPAAPFGATPAAPASHIDLVPAVTAESTSPSVYDLLAGAPMKAPSTPVDEEPAATDAAPALRAVDMSDPWQVPLDEGRFALGGWAAAAGHSVVSGVTFRRRLPDDVGAGQIVLEIDASENVPDGGPVVLSDPGFAPDRDGFTLLLEAAEAGPFSVAGGYRVLPAG